MTKRPSCIVHWEDLLDAGTQTFRGSDEILPRRAAISEAVGLQTLGVAVCVVEPGHRSSWPHAHEKEEEFVFILEGRPDVWIDGNLHALNPGDCVGFPAGTGIAHSILNNTESSVRFLVVGEHKDIGDRLFYPLHPGRNDENKSRGRLWADVPDRPLGPHDALPDTMRTR